MKRVSLLVTAAVLFLFGVNAFAQDEPTKIEVGVNYTLVSFHPTAAGTDSSVLNGGGGSIAYYTPIKWFGVKMDLQGYGSATQDFTIPKGNVALPQGGQFLVQGNMFTYLFGPVIKKRGRVEPYGQVLIGGAHSNLYANVLAATQSGPTINPLITTAAGKTAAPANDAFAMTAGFGLDIHLNRTISVRPLEVGYLLTHFGNDFTGGKNQNNFRYAAGITFNFK